MIVTLVLAVLCTVAVPSPSFPSASVAVVCEAGEDLLFATTQEMPLRLFLAEVAAQAGFQLTELVPTERMVSVVYRRTPLDQALMQILQREGFSFLFVYGGNGSPKLKRVVVLRTWIRSGEIPSLSRASEEPERRIPEDAEVFDADASVEQLLSWTAHREMGMRQAAFEALTLHPTDERARGRLMDGMRDADPSVRSLAIGLLGPFLTQWPGAEDAAMMALRDAELSVRRLALVILSEQSASRMAEVLHIALQDPDPGIRAQTNDLIQGADSAR